MAQSGQAPAGIAYLQKAVASELGEAGFRMNLALDLQLAGQVSAPVPKPRRCSFVMPRILAPW